MIARLSAPLSKLLGSTKADQLPSRIHRHLSIKSADDFFLPNLHATPTLTTGPPATSHVDDEGAAQDVAAYERDIQLLDHELESLLGPLQTKTETDDDTTPPNHLNTRHPTTAPPAAKNVIRNEVQLPHHMALPKRETGHPHVLVINGPCTVVNGQTMGIPWASLQQELEHVATTAGLVLDVKASNHEGTVIDYLLSTSPSTAVVLNCGELLAAYPGIQQALALTRAHSVVLLNEHPFSFAMTAAVGSRRVRQLTGFGASGYKLALVATQDL
ncbi:hypothetical protein, variant [Aphanomyces astaci]|uniref:3-dehydroquinate dehydratase n=1 Tax=Aphanomyces astaci TaxID=112090 RepID=W4H6R6_APHAT|nr:hypothetical protein, variant [Aphanomyces astaci]ETV86813.1 hypothetical protein, variant [Aphanomyces astaci]|eukprot:XP_009823612.1 hypothetical protein, variant [Aphanomyces astaci]